MHTLSRWSLLCGLLMLPWLPAQAETIILAADTWCPFNCEPGSDKPGYMVEIARKALEAEGHTVEYKTLPWTRAIEEAKRGRIHGIFGAVVEEAPDFVFPELSQGVVIDALFVQNTKDWTYSDTGSLADMTLGLIKDYEYSDELMAYLEAHQGNTKRVQLADGETALQLNIRKLLRGRLDVIVEVAPVLRYTANEMGVKDQVKQAGTSGEPDSVYIAFSPAKEASKEYAKRVSDTIAALRASGELAKILAKYNLEDWKSE